MGVVIYIQQAVSRDVEVDLGRREISVPQKFLNAPKVGSSVQQVSGKTMPKCVRTC